MIQLPIEIGDVILTGRFKNKKVTVKEISYDNYGNPLINGRSILKIRMPKVYMNNKIEDTVRKIVREVISELDVTDRPDLEADARRYAELANKMKILEAQLEEMSKEYEGLDNKFRQELEVIGETKDTFIRAGKLLIKIERSAYDKKNKSYKTGWDYLYPRVNATMKQIADEAMAMIETTSRVKSKIAVVNSENTINEGKVSDLINKMVNWVKGKLNKLSSLNKKVNQELTQLERAI